MLENSGLGLTHEDGRGVRRPSGSDGDERVPANGQREAIVAKHSFEGHLAPFKLNVVDHDTQPTETSQSPSQLASPRMSRHSSPSESIVPSADVGGGLHVVKSPMQSQLSSAPISTNEFPSIKSVGHENHAQEHPTDPPNLHLLPSKLRVVRGLRMRAMGSCYAAKQESRHMINLQRAMLADLRGLVDVMRASVSASTQDNVGALEDSFVVVEKTAKMVDIAGKKFDQVAEQFIDDEWELSAAEEDIYNGQFKDRSKRPSTDMGGPATDSEYFGNLEPSAIDKILASLDGETSEPVESQVDLYQDRRQYVTESLSTFDEDLGEIVTANISHDSDPHEADPADLPHELQATAGSHERLSGYAEQESPEENLGEGSQFEWVDVADMIAEAGKCDFLAQSAREAQFSPADLNGFTRWLLYGTPWNDQLAFNRDQALLQPSNLKFFHTWILHVLEAIAQGAPGFAPSSTLKNVRTFNFREYLAKIWMWDPWSRMAPEETAGRNQLDDLSTLPADERPEARAHNVRQQMLGFRIGGKSRMLSPLAEGASHNDSARTNYLSASSKQSRHTEKPPIYTGKADFRRLQLLLDRKRGSSEP